MPVKITSRTSELTGEFSHEISKTVRGADDSDSRWSVKVFIVDGREVEVSGVGKLSDFKPGQNYFMKISSSFHDRWGIQRKYDSFMVAEPSSPEAIQRYLTRAPGIGPALAKKIVAEYGERSLEKCRTASVEVGIKVGIPDRVMLNLANTLKANQQLEKTTIEIDSLLAGRGFPKTTPRKCIEEWGVNCCQIIRENPYVLRRFHGIGFLKCDALYEHLGLPMDAIVRQVECVLHVIESDNEGHTWIHESVISAELRKKISGTNLKMREAIDLAIDEDRIRQRENYYSVAANADAESRYTSDLFNAVNETISERGF